jgi:hypothetical protein
VGEVTMLPVERASYRKCVQRSAQSWAEFQAKRRELLAPADRYGRGAEKLAEDVVRAFLTLVVGWSDAEINPQVERADFVVTQLGVKRLVIETKHPGSLAFSENAARAARLQGSAVRGEVARAMRCGQRRLRLARGRPRERDDRRPPLL